MNAASAAQPAVAGALPARTGLAVPVQDEVDAPDHVAAAVLAEQQGFDTVIAGEIAGPEVFALLGAMAASTSHVRLATGVVSVFARSPALAAMGFRTLASLAPGRVIAGIGVGSRVVVEHWHGGEFAGPAQLLEEYATVLRPLLAGERVTHRGSRLRMERYRVTLPQSPPIPLWFGALTPAGLRLAGRLADGVLLAFCPPDEVARRVALVREGAEASGRDPDALEIATYVNCYVGADVDAGRERMRRLILQYAVQPTHQPAFAGSFPRVDEATAAWNAGDRASALTLVSDDVVDRLTPVSDDGVAVAARAAALRAAGITLPVVYPQVARFGDGASLADAVRLTAEALRTYQGGRDG